MSKINIELVAVNGRLARVSDRLTATMGSTTARLMVLGLLRYGPQTVAQLARGRGLRRQAVQQTVNRLVTDGMAETRPNPNDRRAPLVHSTARGEQVLDEIEPLKELILKELASSVSLEDMKATLHTLHALRAKLDALLDGLSHGDLLDQLSTVLGGQEPDVAKRCTKVAGRGVQAPARQLEFVGGTS